MLEPFLKWPGGKRWLAANYDHLLPREFDRYIEPFLGGGAIFFHLQPKRAILSDSNADLIQSYKEIKRNHLSVHRRLRALEQRHSRAFYYKMRSAKPTRPIDRATRFLYLNRTCFNGIYRVNLCGQFNVPMGTKTKVAYPSGYLSAIAGALQSATLAVADFEKTLSLANAGDFVYVDPPYTVMHNSNNFVKYNDVLFSWRDQERLASAVREACRRGALVLVSNADHKSIRKLYNGLGNRHVVHRSSVLAADRVARRQTSEIVITSYA